MREIKFRAWLKETKEMIPVYQIDFNNGIINSESAWRTESEYILEQFTGLYDRNGVEIYEGDKIKLTQGTGTVEWFKTQSRFMIWLPKSNEFVRFLAGIDYEIIGNIHDQKEYV